MTERSPDEPEHKSQHNSGSGTFVGRDLIGNIVNIILPPQRRGPSTPQPGGPPQDEALSDDYADIGFTVFTLALLAFVLAGGMVMLATGESYSADGQPPAIAERIALGLLSVYAFFACLAALFARLTQVLELWSEQCADTAAQSRNRLLALTPARMSNAAALGAAATASASAVLASFYGWRPFGREVAERAHLARDKASHHASRARAAASRTTST